MKNKPILSLVSTAQGERDFSSDSRATVTHQSLVNCYFETLTLRNNGSIKELLSKALVSTNSPWKVRISDKLGFCVMI